MGPPLIRGELLKLGIEVASARSLG
jgi:hypothetical protein